MDKYNSFDVKSHENMEKFFEYINKQDINGILLWLKLGFNPTIKNNHAKLLAIKTKNSEIINTINTAIKEWESKELTDLRQKKTKIESILNVEEFHKLFELVKGLKIESIERRLDTIENKLDLILQNTKEILENDYESAEE